MLSILAQRGNSTPELTQAHKEYLSDLKCIALLNLMESPAFNPALSWISQKLGCNIEEANYCIEKLISMNFIQRSSKGYEVLRNFRSASERSLGREIALSNFMMIDSQIKESVCDEGNYDNTAFDTLVFTASRETASGLIKEIRSILDKYSARVCSAKDTDVYALSFNVAQITKNNPRSV